jgi:hypothetical protein
MPEPDPGVNGTVLDFYGAELLNFMSQKYWGEKAHSIYMPVPDPVLLRCLCFAPTENGTVSVRNVAVKVDGTFTDICGYAQVANPEEPGSLTVSLTRDSVHLGPIVNPYFWRFRQLSKNNRRLS